MPIYNIFEILQCFRAKRMAIFSEDLYSVSLSATRAVAGRTLMIALWRASAIMYS